MNQPRRRWQPPPLVRGTPTATLSPGEADVLTGLAHGLTNTQIARRLDVPLETVRSRVKKLLRAMSARDRTHAVALAISGQMAVHVADPNAVEDIPIHLRRPA